MLKLPEKKYESKHNKELKYYAQGWNIIVENTKYLYIHRGYAYAMNGLLAIKEYALESLKEDEKPFYEGQYDCIIEIEKLNEEEVNK